jgi:hypothetical protein
VLLAVEGGDCRFGFAIIGHFNESKTLAPPGFPVVNDLGRKNLPMLAE